MTPLTRAATSRRRRWTRAVAGLAVAGGALAGVLPSGSALAATRHVHLSHRETVAAAAAAYPYAHSNPDAVDPWGSYERQCTSFASWYLAHHGVAIGASGEITGPRGTATLGDARTWEAAARQAGYAVTGTPRVGAVAMWRAGERSTWPVARGISWLTAGAEGHVGIVRKVLRNGEVVIDDYNGLSPLGSHEFVGRAPRYLLITRLG